MNEQNTKVAFLFIWKTRQTNLFFHSMQMQEYDRWKMLYKKSARNRKTQTINLSKFF